MNLKALFKRGMNLAKVGRAVYSLRKSTDADKHKWARHYLVDLLGKSRGLPTKVGQLMTMESGDGDLRETLEASITPMAFEEVADILNATYGTSCDTVFRSLDKEGRAASLGQVHFGKLQDGTAVAVKVQYPGIAHAVEAELELLGWLPKVGPAAKWGFNLEGYRDAFWTSFSQELDYGHEKAQQQRYKELCSPLKNVIVPRIFDDLCRPTVLVQSLEEGISLDKAAKLGETQRRSMGRALLEHYLHMLFRHGVVHSDPNPNNFAFRQTGRDSFSLVVYDFGSVLEIPAEMRLALLRIILALRHREKLDPVSCLTAIGFDNSKLEDLRPTLPALLNVLFDPFVTEAPYDIKDWNLSERFDQIVGDLKWWFRSAAPPNLIFLMRTLHGMVAMLERLECTLSWRFSMDNICGDIYAEARAFALPKVEAAKGLAPGFDGIARYLQIYVVKPNGNKVRLTMPARVAECLEEVIDPPVMESIVRQNIDLKQIQDRVRKSGFVPQTLFDLKDPERDVRVWLE